jgi:hypothetical protein
MTVITREESVNFVFKSKLCKSIVNTNHNSVEVLKENEIILLSKISVRKVITSLNQPFYFIDNTIIHNSSKYRMSYSAYDFDIETNRKEFVNNALSHIKWKEYFEKV